MPAPGGTPGAPSLDPVVQLVEATITLARTSGLPVYDGEVPPDAPAVYAVAYSDIGTPSRTTMRAESDRMDARFQVTTVGPFPEEVRWAVAALRSVLLDQQPASFDRRVWPLTITASQPVTRDSDVAPPVFFAVDVYRLSSVPA